MINIFPTQAIRGNTLLYDNIRVVSLWRSLLFPIIKGIETMEPSDSSRTKIFVAYSHKDKKHLEELQDHLAYYERIGNIEFWDETRITPGSRWQREVQKALKSARVVLLLISPDFLASDFISKYELSPLLEAADYSGAIILPILLRPCPFMDTPLTQYQFLNSPSKPLSTMSRSAREQAWTEMMRKVVDILKPLSIAPTTPPQDTSDLALSKQPAISSLKTTLYTYLGHSARVNAANWSPDGQYVASASDDKTVQIWDARTGRHGKCQNREHNLERSRKEGKPRPKMGEE